jgi:hypothetical protein
MKRKGEVALTSNQQQEANQEQKLDNIKELGQLEIPAYKSDVHCLTIRSDLGQFLK